MGDSEHREMLVGLQTALEEERTRVRSMRDAAAEQIGNARQVLRACAGGLEKSQSDIDGLTAATELRLQSLRERIESLADSDGLKEQIEALESKFAASESTSEDLTRRLEEQSARGQVVDKLESQLAEVTADLAKAREELDQTKTDLEQARATGNDAVAKIKTSFDESEASRRALEKDKARFDESLEAANARAGEAEAGCSRMQEDLRALRQEADEWRGMAESAEKNLEGLEALRGDLNKAKEALADEAAARGAINEEIAALRKEAEQLRAELKEGLSATEADRLRQALEDARVRASKLDKELEDERSRGNKSALAAQLAEALRDAETAHAQLRALRSASPDSVRAENAPEAATHRLSEADQVARIMEASQSGGQNGKRTIGELLVGAGVITQAQMDEAIDVQKGNTHQHVGAILIEKGFASDAAVAQALAAQCGVAFIQLGEERVDAGAARLITERLANQHVCIPVEASGNRVVLAMQNPLDLVAIEDIERSTGRNVEYVVATATDIHAAIGRYYWEPE